MPVTFYFDVGSPYAWLAAERVDGLLGPGVAWRPVLLGGIFKATGRASWAIGDQERRDDGMAGIERRAAAYGLPPVRWPDPWPSDYLHDMRAVTAAGPEGPRFGLALMRAAFTEGRDTALPETVAAVAAEHGVDLGPGPQDPGVKAALRAATDAAVEAGVFGIPTVEVDGELFWGDDRLEEAAAAAARRGSG